jgi:hypothetical protein
MVTKAPLSWGISEEILLMVNLLKQVRFVKHHTDREVGLTFLSFNIFIDMKPEEINIPKNYVDKTDETRNKLIRNMFPISEKKDEPKTKD